MFSQSYEPSQEREINGKKNVSTSTIILMYYALFIIIIIQFSHADFTDGLMILMAILFSVITGTIIPLESIIMGQLFGIFISYNTADRLHPLLITNGSITCTTETAQLMLNSFANVSDQIFCDATREGNVISSASTFLCDPDQTLREEATTYSLYFVYVGVATFVFKFLTNVFWTITALRQSKRLRIEYYRAILQHNISWFDTNDVSRVGPEFLKYVLDVWISTLFGCLKSFFYNRSIENIQAGIGIQAGYLLRDVITFLFGIVWAFTISWKLTLAVLVLLPIVSVLGGLNISVQ